MTEETVVKKKRGRPAKAEKDVDVKPEEIKARPSASNRSGRPRRSSVSSATTGPLAMTGKLDKDNYAYRIVNDEGGRVDLHKEYGYEIVQDNDVEFVGGNAVKTGSAKTVVVDKRTGKKGVLMRQPIEFHEEDKKAKAELIAKREESMFRKLKTDEGRYGDVDNSNSLAKTLED